MQWTAKSARANLPCIMRTDGSSATHASHHMAHAGPPADRAAALAPGGVGNIGPGLDVLGMAVTGPGDRVTAQRTQRRGVTMTSAGHPDLSLDARLNAAGIAASA